MTWLEALLLGIIQGLTEFLPVSSSGHLELGKALMGDDSLPEESMLFTVVVHAATALSTVVVYRKDILELIKGFFKFEWNDETRFVVYVVISMIPAAFVGLFFEEEIEALFSRNVLLVGGMLCITALLLFFADRVTQAGKDINPRRAFLIGVAQAIAILPGISRSGATIASSILLGVDRVKAARFSFLMVIPLILGKMILDTREVIETGANGSSINLTVGFIAAFVAGLFACNWMIALVKKARLRWFAWYCLIAGIAAVLMAGFS